MLLAQATMSSLTLHEFLCSDAHCFASHDPDFVDCRSSGMVVFFVFESLVSGEEIVVSFRGGDKIVVVVVVAFIYILAGRQARDAFEGLVHLGVVDPHLIKEPGDSARGLCMTVLPGQQVVEGIPAGDNQGTIVRRLLVAVAVLGCCPLGGGVVCCVRGSRGLWGALLVAHRGGGGGGGAVLFRWCG